MLQALYFLGAVLFRFITFSILLSLLGCGSSSSSDSTSSGLIGTVWLSPSCAIAYARTGYHEIEFTSDNLIFTHTFYTDGCDDKTPDPQKYVVVRPYTSLGTVVTESGVSATKVIVTTQFLPADEHGDNIHDVIDFVYINGNQLYFSDKATENCKEWVTHPQVRHLGCTEWSAILDFDYTYTQI